MPASDKRHLYGREPILRLCVSQAEARKLIVSEVAADDHDNPCGQARTDCARNNRECGCDAVVLVHSPRSGSAKQLFRVNTDGVMSRGFRSFGGKAALAPT